MSFINVLIDVLVKLVLVTVLVIFIFNVVVTHCFKEGVCVGVSVRRPSVLIDSM